MVIFKIGSRMLSFYIAIGVFAISIVVMATLLSIRVYEANSGKLLFSRKRLERSDEVLLKFYKRASKFLRLLALMSVRRKAFKMFRLGKLKHFFNRTKRVIRKRKQG